MHRGLLVAIVASGLPGMARAQLRLEAHAAHFDRRLSDGGAVERQTGLIAGGSVGLATRVVILSVAAAGGKLSAKTSATPDADYGRVNADLALVLAPSVRFHVAMLAAAFASEAGSQRWIVPRVGFEIRTPFTAVPVTAHFAGSLALGTSTNAPLQPRTGFDIRGGVEAGGPRAALTLQYQLQRLSFAVGTARQEQWGEVAIGVRITP